MSPANIKGLQKGRDKKETTVSCLSVKLCILSYTALSDISHLF